MEHLPSKTLAAEFYEFRRDAYAYRNQADDNLKKEIDGIRHEARVTTRWSIGLAVVMIIAIGGLLRDWAVSYEDTERTLDKIVERVDGHTEHARVQDKALESLNDRLRVLEQIESKRRQ